MKNTLIKLVALTLSVGIISSTAVMAENEIKVYIDEKQVDFDVKPIIYEDRTLVPLRAIFEALGAEVTWNQDTRTASAVRGDDTMSITIDSKQLFKNNEAVELDVPAMIVNDRTLVPVRAISESFDCDVQWDGETQTVMIYSKEEIRPTQLPVESPLPIESTEATKLDKDKIKYYSDFQTVPDFGVCFGYEDDIMDTAHFYEGTKEEDRKNYADLLELLGFEKVDEMITPQVESYGYEKDGIQIVTALYNIDAMKNVYGIDIHRTLEKYNGEIKFYKKYKSVPDIGILDDVQLANTSEIADNITEYSYIVSDGANLELVLRYYLDMLAESGFSEFSQTLSNAMYVNNDTKNTVIIQMNIDSDNNSIISITVEQWIEE